ncbi:MAG: carbohydrate kinase family protein [Chloroflexi bacterium]|nr:carbohydrate kinase family protein [Chloroflexota bacterium]
MYDAVVAGHLCIDIMPEIDAQTARSSTFLAPGRLTEVSGVVFSTGGAVSNTGQALYKLGINVRLAARVGDDALGNLIRETLGRTNPAFSAMPGVGCGEPSSFTLVIAPPGIDRTFLHCPGTNNTFGAEDIDEALLGEVRLFHFGYPPLLRRMYADDGLELTAIFKRAKAQGATTSLDMSLPDISKPSGQANWPLILKRALPYVDLFMPSIEELLLMLRRQRYMELIETVGAGGMLQALSTAEIVGLAEEAMALGAKIVVVKLGNRGVYIRTNGRLADLGRGDPADLANWRSRELWAPCFKVHVVSTAGSGDATIAGFLAGMLKGQTLEAAANSAVGVGACNVEAMDTTSGIRSWDETQARIRAGWAKLEVTTPGEGWVWDPAASLWHSPRDKKGD